MTEKESERRRAMDRDMDEVKTLLREISGNQTGFAVEISYIKQGMVDLKETVAPLGKEVAVLGQKVEDMESDIQQQWGHITNIKDALRDLEKSNNEISHMAADNEFWDADTKKMVIRWGMIMISLAFITAMGISLSDVKELL